MVGRRPGDRVVVIELAPAPGVREDRPGIVDQAHLLRGRRDGIGALEVGVVALRELPVSARHLQWRRVARHAQDRVWIEGPAGLHRADSTAARGPASV